MEAMVEALWANLKVLRRESRERELLKLPLKLALLFFLQKVSFKLENKHSTPSFIELD